MRVVIVYESLFGNTREIAKAIKNGIRASDPTAGVLCVRTGQAAADLLEHTDLLLVGGPTHMHGMTTGLSRKVGALLEKKPHHPVAQASAGGVGLRDWFHRLPRPISGSRAAAFDTRLDSPRSGAAAEGIARRLRNRGYTLVAEPQGFLVENDGGPLLTGELSRATVWGSLLCEYLGARV